MRSQIKNQGPPWILMYRVSPLHWGGGTIPTTKYKEDLRGSCLGQPSFSHRLSIRLAVSSSKEEGPPRRGPAGGLFHLGETATGSALGVSQRCQGLSGAPGAEAAGDYS